MADEALTSCVATLSAVFILGGGRQVRLRRGWRWNTGADYGLERWCFSRMISSGGQPRTSVSSIHASM
jgi:hypothetical protein